ncbi:MAG TPA: hypothetical protein VK968_12545, partial [Roseimicrobium sp.]|nr:hypothetical protein [Roseimicrobium sp.]
QLNPAATPKRQNYAWYAYHCGKWDQFNELVAMLGKVDYEFFGGKEEFDKMMRTAAEHSSVNPTSKK